MRRRDKLKNIQEINKKINESAFTWNGTYEDEKTNEATMALGNDLETLDEKEDDCGCELTESEPTDVKSSQWFSDEDGERLTDKIEP